MGRLTAMAYSPLGREIASTGSTDRTIIIWDIERREPERTLRGHSGSVNSVSFLPDGCFVSSATFDGTMRIWEV